MISGKVFDLDSTDWKNKDGEVVFKSLPVWDSVIMIAERSQIRLKD
jgi:hypothetical protein